MSQELEQARAQLDQVKAESRSILEAQAALLKEAQAGAKAKTEALAQVNRRAGRLEVAVGFLLAVVTLGTLAAGVLALLR